MPLQIRTTGVEDYMDGSANIKALIIGGPGSGKTRMASYWPKPIYLDCENGRGSLADRTMPYVEIRTSKDALDALDYLKSLQGTAKGSRQYQTVVLDTVDSFQRLVKDEWVQQTKAGSFSGYDAWGYLDTKMQFLFTRLLNLDYNVIVNVHYKDKTFKDGEDTHREFTLQLQGAISDQIFNDFGLVGYLGTYWEASPDGRVQKRGLTFEPTPDKPFLKDRFNVTPKWMEVVFDDADYRQIFEAFFDQPAFEGMTRGTVVGEIPDADKLRSVPTGPVNPPSEGGPLTRKPPLPPITRTADTPLEKYTKEELIGIAKENDIDVRGNALKSEIVDAIREKQPPKTPAAPSPNDAPPASPPEPHVDTEVGVVNARTGEIVTPTVQTPTPLTPEQVAARIGATVISEEKHDAPDVPATPPAQAPQGPGACADCGNDLGVEWEDSAKRPYVRLSFVKFRRYLCGTCYATAISQ